MAGKKANQSKTRGVPLEVFVGAGVLVVEDCAGETYLVEEGV